MDGLFRRRRLPHLDVAGGTYFVTAALAGSRPARGLSSDRPHHMHGTTSASPHEPWMCRRHASWEHALDTEPLTRWLARHDLADIVHRAILHGAGVHYDLIAHVVMPSHVHIVFRTFDDVCPAVSHRESATVLVTPRQRILHSIRSYSARACNRVLCRTGAFWQRECYDHWLRNEHDIRSAVEYVARNPVVAGLCRRPEEWRFASRATS